VRRWITSLVVIAVALFPGVAAAPAGSPAEGMPLLVDHMPAGPLLASVYGVEDPVGTYDRLVAFLREILVEQGEVEVSQFDQGVAALDAELGLSLRNDLFAHLGPEVGITLDLAPADEIMGIMAAPSEEGIAHAFGGILVLARVRDDAAMEASLRKLFTREEFHLEAVDGLFAISIAEDGEDAEPSVIPRLFWGIRSGVLAFGIDPVRLRTALEGWPEGQRLRDGGDFARVFENLHANPDSLIYFNLPRVRRMVEESQALQGMLQGDDEARSVFDLFTKWVDTGMGIGSTTTRIGEGSLQMTYGPAWLSTQAATLGVIAAVAIPNFLNAVDRGKQKRTMADISSLGTAMEAFAVDNGGYPAATSMEELVPQIQPRYILEAPTIDGWGNPLLVVSGTDGYVIASPGKDGEFQNDWAGGAPGGGATATFDDDIVYRNGTFVQAPQ